MSAGCLLSVLSLVWTGAYFAWHFLRETFIDAGWAKPVDEQQSSQSFSRALLVGLILFVVGLLMCFAFPAR
jgi:mannitol-specific phosphotransferase system IIBC component